MAKILLVEDDKSLREIYGVRLRAEGYEIVSAGDGEEALAMAIKEKPDLIVSDVMMPKISGFDMLDILRSTTETKGVKVIMMTALSSDDQRARGEALGADRYLVKSQVGIEDVVRTVHEVLGDGAVGASAPPAAAAPSPFGAPLPQPALDQPAPSQFIATPIADPAPVANVAPAPFGEPIAAPSSATDPFASAPVAPISEPFVAPAPLSAEPIAAPVAVPAPTTTVAPLPPIINMPSESPAPVFTPPVPTGAILPEPTAPFSSPAPASLGDRVINPITPTAEMQTPPDMSTLMSQELSGISAPVAPLPPAPTVPPLPPQPTI